MRATFLTFMLFLPSFGTSALAEIYHVPLFVSADHSNLTSFMRITHHTCKVRPSLTIHAVDDSGEEFGPVEIPWRAGPYGCGQIVKFNSRDLERGNVERGLHGALGNGEGNWQLFIESTAPVQVMSYVRSADGLVAPMHDTVPFWEGRNSYFIGTFNPARNTNQRSILRIINPYPQNITVEIFGQEDIRVGSYLYSHSIELLPFEVLTVNSRELETRNPEWANGPFEGRLGDGTQTGKWRLYLYAHEGRVVTWKNLVVMNLMQMPTGHLINMSSVPGLPDGEEPDPGFIPRAPSQWEIKTTQTR